MLLGEGTKVAVISTAMIVLYAISQYFIYPFEDVEFKWFVIKYIYLLLSCAYFAISTCLRVKSDDWHTVFANPSYKTKEDAFVNSKGNGKAEAYFSNVSGGDKYRGAGYIQLTHDYTCRDFANYVGDPDIFNKGYSYVAENYPWEAAAWFWAVYKNNFGLHQKAKDGASVEAITKIVNGGDNGLEKRKKYYNLAKSIFMGE